MDFDLGDIMEIKLRQAYISDVPALKQLWRICFGDRMRYINVFFEKMFVAENTVVALADGNLAGVVYILERSLNGNRFMYGYAIGVFPQYRGNNICEIMLGYVKKKAESEGCIFGLHPANEKLAEFYQRIGLKEMYTLKEVDASNYTSDAQYEFCDISADELYDLRKDAFENAVEWDKNALKYILKNGEIVKAITLHNEKRYFVLRKDENNVFVKETSATDSEIKEVSQFIRSYYDAKNIKYLLSSKSALQGVIKPVVYGFSDKNDEVYMNLFLD